MNYNLLLVVIRILCWFINPENNDPVPMIQSMLIYNPKINSREVHIRTSSLLARILESLYLTTYWTDLDEKLFGVAHQLVPQEFKVATM